jgi:hypothetical protein
LLFISLDFPRKRWMLPEHRQKANWILFLNAEMVMKKILFLWILFSISLAKRLLFNLQYILLVDLINICWIRMLFLFIFLLLNFRTWCLFCVCLMYRNEKTPCFKIQTWCLKQFDFRMITLNLRGKPRIIPWQNMIFHALQCC